MKVSVEFTDEELKEIHSIISIKLEGVEYAIDEVEDTPELQIKKHLLEKILSKLNIAYNNEKEIQITNQ